MAGYELLSDQGLRLDGRRSGELRRIRCKVGVFGQADGSAYFEQVKKSNVTNLYSEFIQSLQTRSIVFISGLSAVVTILLTLA